MEIEGLNLENWRNYSKVSFVFKGVTLLVGANASGKTNILEAVYYLACGKSFRGKDEYLVGWGKDFSRVQAGIKREKKEDLLVVLEKKGKIVKTVKIKGQKRPSSHLLGHFNCVLFTPEEIDLVSTLPEARRRYLNLIISQNDKEYSFALIHYKKTLEHRNALLRRINEGTARKEELEVWDGKLAEFGGQLIEKRKQFLDEVNQSITRNYKLLSGDTLALEVRYLPNVQNEWAGFIGKLLANREKDIITKVTNAGPHRDDLAFILNGKDITEFGSRGEFRTVILALKLSELEFFEKQTGSRPVLLLDDVFSELDETRRDFLSQIFKKQQTIVTTTDLDHVSKDIVKEAKIIEL